MSWLIIEDALRDKKGHWFEYLNTFDRELRGLGDEVTILADHLAEPIIIQQLRAEPVLPDSIWHRMGDAAGPGRRYLRVPVHAWRTYRAVKRYLRNGKRYDVIFVPTVLVHHLLGWVWLIKRGLKRRAGRVLLFFPNTPIRLDPKTGEPRWQPAPTAKLFDRLIRSLKTEVEQGRVILGAETHPMCEALTRLTGVTFTYFPHPVQAEAESRGESEEGREAGARSRAHSPLSTLPSSPGLLTFASFGGARHEKGSDLLVGAVEEYCRRFPESRVRFVLQCVEGDRELWERLKGNPKVRLIPNYFGNGEYARELAQTDALLLPYRRTSYGLRVSRVVIEAMVHGIPVITTRQTTLEDQAKEFGAALFCEDGKPGSLVEAMHEMEQSFSGIKTRAETLKTSAQNHFMVREFRQILLRAPCFD